MLSFYAKLTVNEWFRAWIDGTCYKNKGQEQAIALGHELVQGEVKQARLDAWLEFIKNNPNGALYCFRGGLRSQITQEWIYEASGVNYPRIKGGYKALRRFLIDETDLIMNKITPVVIGGQNRLWQNFATWHP